MAEIANTLWYRLGNVTVTDGSTKVTGVGTHWTTAGINPGATFRVDGRYLAHEVKRVVSDTEIELGAPYYGGSASGATYSIDRNFQSTTNAKLAADVTDLVGLYEQVRDGIMPTIEGKSAYQVAVANGYVGTEAQWLESLKGAGEITAINTKLSRIYTNNAMAHNAVPRGANLGTSITAAQMQAIRNGTFDNLYIGDYWNLPIDGTTTAIITAFGINPHWDASTNISDNNLILWLTNYNWVCPINDTATCEGHLKGSKIYTETMPEILAKIKTVIPPEYIASRSTEIYDSIDANGNPNHYESEVMQIFLPSVRNLDLDYDNKKAGLQFISMPVWPYFQMQKQPRPRWSYWLCNSYSTTHWCAKHKACESIDALPADTNQYICCWPYIFLA